MTVRRAILIERTPFTGLTVQGPDASMTHIEAPIRCAAVNLPTPPHSDPVPPQEVLAAKLQAWRELKQQMEQLHAQLHYLKLMLKLGVGGR